MIESFKDKLYRLTAEELNELEMAVVRLQAMRHGMPSVTDAGIERRDSATPDVQRYDTGAFRSARIPRYDLIAGTFLSRLARRCTGIMRPDGPDGGALKYGEGNWEKGLPTSDVINHVIKHLTEYQERFRQALSIESRYGKESWERRIDNIRCFMIQFSDGDDHLAGAAWGLMVLMEQERTQFYHDPLFEKERDSEVPKVDSDQRLPGRSVSITTRDSGEQSSPAQRGEVESPARQDPRGASTRTSTDRG